MAITENRLNTVWFSIPLNDLDEVNRNLFSNAVDAARHAYAPYSGYHVGAALWMEDGRIITGSNQENAAYPVGLCAERVAVFKAVSSDQKSKILRMLVIAYDPRVKTVLPVTPCGSCRQTILEYENNQGSPIAIIFSTAKDHFIFFERTSDLLPMGFNATHLNPENHSSP